MQSGLSCPVPHLFLPRAGQDIKNSQASVISRLVCTCNGLTSVNLLGECYLWLVSRRRGGGGSGKVIHWFGCVFQFSAHHSAAGEEELPRKGRRLRSRSVFPASLDEHRASPAVAEGPGGWAIPTLASTSSVTSLPEVVSQGLQHTPQPKQLPKGGALVLGPR